MSDNAPSVAPTPAVLDIPSGGDSPSRGSEPASPSRPPSSRTSVEDLTAMSAIEGLGVEQQVEDETPDIPEQTRRSSRAQRYRRALEAARAQAKTERIGRQQALKTLKERFGDEPAPAPESNLSGRVPDRTAPDGSEQEPAQYDDEAQQPEPEQYDETQYEPASPEEQEAARQEFGERAVKEIEARAAYSERERHFARMLPNYHEALRSVSDIPIPDHVAEMIRESPYGPIISYGLAASNDGRDELDKLQRMNPTQAARWVGKSEATVEAMMRQRTAPHQPARRATQAPRPITPLRGGGAAPPSQLGAVNNYIKKLYGDRG